MFNLFLFIDIFFVRPTPCLHLGRYFLDNLGILPGALTLLHRYDIDAYCIYILMARFKLRITTNCHLQFNFIKSLNSILAARILFSSFRPRTRVSHPLVTVGLDCNTEFDYCLFHHSLFKFLLTPFIEL